ncbi:Ada metal-binding domain-containing protein [Streptomyces sp. NPDC057702]|uniref:Ada metal-binding domain-containing protein n=1 Tax=unclassified Streptomyces TaxID=2593676 RepID=UPI00368F7665
MAEPGTAGDRIPVSAERPAVRYTLLDRAGRRYPSAVPGALGGHRAGRLYGRLDCPSALRALARGGYRAQRVFFADAATARAAGYRPCAVCLPTEYARWRARPAHGAGTAGAWAGSIAPTARGSALRATGRARSTEPRGGPVPEAEPDARPSGAAPVSYDGSGGHAPLGGSRAALTRSGPDAPSPSSGDRGRRPRAGVAPALPAPHTDLELAALLDLLTSRRVPARTLSIGHGRDDASRAAARAVAAAWCGQGPPLPGGAGLGRGAGEVARSVLEVVDWPEEAASWLRQARRLTAGPPDAWVVCGAPAGWAGMARRLRRSTAWSAERTYALASLGTPEAVALAGARAVEGLRGACPDGGHWEVRRGWITFAPPRSRP